MKTAASVLFPLLFFIVVVKAQLEAGLDEDFENGFDNSAASLVIEHSLDGGTTWTPRSTVNLRSLKTDNAIISNLGVVTDEDRRKFKVLLKNYGFYKIRAPSRLNIPSALPAELADADEDPNDVATRYVSTFVRACAMFESELNDRITIHLGSHSHVVGISLAGSLSNNECSIKSADDLDESVVAETLTQFSTEVVVDHVTQGPAPDTFTFLQKMERKAQEDAKGQTQDNRSFIAKYWMYLVPAVIFLVMNSAAAPEGGGGGN